MRVKVSDRDVWAMSPFRDMNTQPEVETGHVTDEGDVPRFSLYRLCQCSACRGSGRTYSDIPVKVSDTARTRCSICRGEGRIRQELAACDSPEAVGVALVTLAREGEWLDEDGNPCQFGLLDREGEKGKRWLILPKHPDWHSVHADIHDNREKV